MIQKIVLYIMLPLAILALFLALNGVTRVQFGNSYYNFLQNVGRSFNAWSFQIPNIPKVPRLEKGGADGDGIFALLKAFVNFWIILLNTLVTILNVIITIFNTIIMVTQFILTLIYQCKDFITGLSNASIVFISNYFV